LSGILQKKRKSAGADESEATGQFMEVDSTVSVSSSGMLDTGKASSQSILTADSSAACNRNPNSQENNVTSVADKPDHCSEVNLSAVRESHAESGRNSSSLSRNPKQYRQRSGNGSDNYKPSKQHQKPSLLGHPPSVSKQRVQPQVSRSSRRSMLGPAPVQRTGKVAVMSNCATQRRNGESLSSKSSNRKYCVPEEHKTQEVCPRPPVQESESEASLLETYVDKPSSAKTVDHEHLHENEELFTVSPPRKVVLKYRTCESKMSADTTGQRKPAVTDAVLSPVNQCRNLSSRVPNSKDRKQPSVQAKPSLLGQSPSASKPCVQPPLSQSSKRKFSGIDKSLLGPGPSTASESERGVSKRRKKPLLPLPEQSRDRTKPDRNSYRLCGQKTYRHSPAKGFTGGRLKQSAERSKWLKNGDESIQDRHTPRFEVGFKKEPLRRHRDEETSWQEGDGASVLEDDRWQYDNRHRESSQQEWQDRDNTSRPEEDEWQERRYDNRYKASLHQEWQERDGASRLEEDRWQERQYDNRHRECLQQEWRDRDSVSRIEDDEWQERQCDERHMESLQPERITDLRQKLNSYRRNKNRCCRDPQHRDEDHSSYRESCRESLLDDPPMNCVDGDRLLHASPRQRHCELEDESDVVDDPYYGSRRHCHESLGDFSGQRYNSLLEQDNGDSWLHVDCRQPWDYRASSVIQEPRDSWNREVSLYLCLSRID